MFKIVLTPLGCFERLPPHTEQIKQKMRTKTLLLTAALSAAGVASTMAQVYSVNAVGYVNVRVAAGPNKFQIIANPLKAADNKVSALLPDVPEETTIYKWNGNGYTATSFSFGAWSDPNVELKPGEAAFIQNPSAQELTLTFVGEVSTGTLTTALAQGFNMISSQVPQTGKLQTDLGYTPADEDTVYQFTPATQQYAASAFTFGAWDPSEPTIAVGEGFFLQKQAAGSWTRTFSVN